jgi:hypothetical protein
VDLVTLIIILLIIFVIAVLLNRVPHGYRIVAFATLLYLVLALFGVALFGLDV